MTGEPILGKAHPEPHRDYKLLTWPRFLRLRRWAQRVADAEGAPVYLVGSALTKRRPRDLDVSIIVPHDRFVAQFGPIPSNATAHEDARGMDAYLNRLHHYLFVTRPYWRWMIAEHCWMHYTRVDFRICPDSWWPEKGKLLLAAPCAQAGEQRTEAAAQA